MDFLVPGDAARIPGILEHGVGMADVDVSGIQNLLIDIAHMATGIRVAELQQYWSAFHDVCERAFRAQEHIPASPIPKQVGSVNV